MDFNTLPKDLKEFVNGLRHGSYTIQCDVDDAIEQAANWEDAKSTIESRMNDLIGEAIGIIQGLCDGCVVLVDLKDVAKKMIEEDFTKERIFPHGSITKGNFDEWTNILMDKLTCDYDIETLVRKQITGEE